MDELYLIDSFEMHIAVEPVARAVTDRRGLEVTHGRTRRWVRTDNLARLRRVVAFAPDNRRVAPFEYLRYVTQNGGAIRNPDPRGSDNEADMNVRGLYDRSGDCYYYRFTPRPAAEYSLSFEVLKGFDRGHRHAHFHLPRPALMRQVVLSLDLARYVDAGFALTQRPALFLHREEPPSHDYCDLRERGRPVGPAADGPRRWEWVLPDVGGGVVDVWWDVAAPPGFEEWAGPATPTGLERMADRALDLVEELQHFYLIGAGHLGTNEGAFSLKQCAATDAVASSDKTLGRHMDRVSELFRAYFAAFGHPPDHSPFTPPRDDADAPLGRKVMETHAKSRRQICEPVGRWAWELAGCFLRDRGLLPTAEVTRTFTAEVRAMSRTRRRSA